MPEFAPGSVSETLLHSPAEFNANAATVFLESTSRVGCKIFVDDVLW